MPTVTGNSDNATPAVIGDNSTTTGDPTGSDSPRETAGVAGQSKLGHGVVGTTLGLLAGVMGAGPIIGVAGTATGNGIGVRGIGGEGPQSTGVHGQGSVGVFGNTGDGGRAGVMGIIRSAENPGVLGRNGGTGPGIIGESINGAGVAGISEQGTGIVGRGGAFAAQFVGTVEVQGDITVSGDVTLSGADYAEALSTAGQDIEVGTVVVLGSEGNIRPCDRDYDTAVAGIVSGACGVKPAIVLDRHEGAADVALIGKVWCRADAVPAPIRPGDLLTTSSTVGHCRRVTEPARAFGAVIGKALTPLAGGQGLVRVLVGTR